MKQIFEQYGEAIVAFIGFFIIAGIIAVVLLGDSGFLSNLISEVGNNAV